MKWATLTPTQDICGRTRIINQNSEILFTNLFFRDEPGANFYVREAGAGGLPAEEEGLPIQGDQYRGAGLPLHQVGGRDPSAIRSYRAEQELKSRFPQAFWE